MGVGGLMAKSFFLELLEGAMAPLRALAERMDAQLEAQAPVAVLAETGSLPFKRATTSSLTLASSSPHATKTSPFAAPRLVARPPTRLIPPPRPAVPPARKPLGKTAPTPAASHVLLEGPDGAQCKVPSTARFAVQITTQGSASERLEGTLQLRADGGTVLMDETGRPYAIGKVSGIEEAGRAITLTVNFAFEGQAGQGTLFVGFQGDRLAFLSGSGTVRDEAGRTVVRDLAAVTKPGKR